MRATTTLLCLTILFTTLQGCAGTTTEAERAASAREAYVWDLDASATELGTLEASIQSVRDPAARAALERRSGELRELLQELRAEAAAVETGEAGGALEQRLAMLRREIERLRLGVLAAGR